MQDFFFVGIICAIALGVVIFKSIFFFIHIRNLKYSNRIIENNLNRHKIANHQSHAVQEAVKSIESVNNWRVSPYEDPRQFTEDLRQQFLAKTKTRKSPSDRLSPRERVPLATTDFGEVSDEEFDNSTPIYTYNPNIGGTQV